MPGVTSLKMKIYAGCLLLFIKKVPYASVTSIPSLKRRFESGPVRVVEMVKHRVSMHL
jgi:hypothetical protein